MPTIQSPNPARILIVDDHPLVREGLAALIQTDASLVLAGQAGSGAEARVAVERCRPDVLLLDLSLPDVDGMDLILDLRSRYPAIPVLVLSMHEESVYAVRALRAGASGYVMKHSSARAIVEAIWTVLRGGTAFSEAVALTKPFLVASRKRRKDSPPQQGVDALSDRELQVFDAIGRGRSTQQIANLWSLSDKTIETYRANIKKKLGIATAAALIHEAFRWVEAESSRRLGQESIEC